MSAISYIPDQPAAQVHASLRSSLAALEEAHQCSVLWFGEVMRRKLFRDLGHSSINQYAIQELGFSKSRTDDFVRLARQLEKLPAVREAVAAGELGYTKAREIVSVATPETQDAWLKAAKGTRKDLINEVKKVKRAARWIRAKVSCCLHRRRLSRRANCRFAFRWTLLLSRKLGGRQWSSGCTSWGACPPTVLS